MNREQVKKFYTDKIDEFENTLLKKKLTMADRKHLFDMFIESTIRNIEDVACGYAFEQNVKKYGGRSVYNRAMRELSNFADDVESDITPDKLKEIVISDDDEDIYDDDLLDQLFGEEPEESPIEDENFIIKLFKAITGNDD